MSTNLQLEFAKKESDKASKAKSAFLASVSHEIRTPLNSIIGAIDLLKQQDLSREQLTLFKLMGESSETLLQLLTDVLDLSKIEADKIKIRQESLDVLEFAKTMANFTEALIVKEKKDIEFNYSVDDIPIHIATDEVRLTQILTNLLSNAVKYTVSGSVTLTIEARHGDNGNEIKFCVKDTGMGIEPENLEFIKRPFNQVSDYRGDQEGKPGVGLGLTISRSLLRLMNGRLELTSEFGVGSKFTAIVPLIESSMEETEEIQDPNPIYQFVNTHVLIVEDNKFNQVILQKMLESLGVTCDIANTGFECLELWKLKPYNVILMDLNMPGLDGIETTKRILADKEVDQFPTIIAVTANVLEQDEARCKEAGMQGFLPKPITIRQLQSRLSAVMN